MANYYTRGYEAAAQAAGMTGTADVKALQQQLNAAGAGLDVDGIWGPATDAAYQSRQAQTVASPQTDYFKQLDEKLTQTQSQSYANPFSRALEELAKIPTDEEYVRKAKNAVLPGYEAEKEALRQGLEETSLSYQLSRANQTRQAEENRARINADYAARQGELSVAALRRGMGRSSHYLDSSAYLGQMQNAALAAGDTELSRQLSQLDAAQSLAVAHHGQTLARLESELVDNLAEYEQALREKDKASARLIYQKLADNYDAYERYRSQDTFKLLTTLYGFTKSAEAQSRSSGSSSGKTMTESEYDLLLKELGGVAYYGSSVGE